MSEKFKFEYNAPTEQERKEIESIKNQYLPKDEKSIKFEKLKKLDNKVKNTPIAISISLGIIGSLIFGLGMTFFLEWVDLWLLGIPCAIIGLIIVILAYPLHIKISSKLKAKYKDEIISLSNELLNK